MTAKNFPMQFFQRYRSLLPAPGLRAAGIGYVILLGLAAIFFGRYAYSGHRVLVELFVWATVPPLVWLYLCGFRAVQSSTTPPLKLIVGVAAISGLLAVAITPFNSTDVYAYVNAGWLQAHYGLSPYASVVSDVPDWRAHEIFSAYWPNEPFIYGPVFARICKTLCWLGNGSLFYTVLWFKLANLVAFGLSGLLLYAAARRQKIARPDLSLYLFLWNPLILLHVIGNAHNDIFTIVFLLLALHFVLIDRWLWVCTALVGSVMIKYMSVILVPFFFVLCWKKKRVVQGVAGLVLASVILWIVCLPYIGAFRNVRYQGISLQFSDTTTCLFQSLSETYIMLTHLMPSLAGSLAGFQWFVKLLLGAIFAIVYAVAFFEAAKDEEFTPSKLVGVSLMLLTLLLCVASATFYPWYLALLLPLACLLEQGHWLRVLAVVLTCVQMLSFTGLAQAHVINYLVMIVLPLVWVLRRYRPFAGVRKLRSVWES